MCTLNQVVFHVWLNTNIFKRFMHAAAALQLFALTHPITVTQLQQFFGSSPSSWVQHMKSSRVWLDAWLAVLCACAFLISLLRRALDVSSSITHDLAEAWLTSKEDEDATL